MARPLIREQYPADHIDSDIGRILDTRYLTTAEAGRRLGRSEGAVRKRLRKGTLPGLRTRLGTFIPIEAVERELAARHAG